MQTRFAVKTGDILLRSGTDAGPVNLNTHGVGRSTRGLEPGRDVRSDDQVGHELAHVAIATAARGTAREYAAETNVAPQRFQFGRPGRRSASPRVGLLTLSASTEERGGVEVFNDQLRAALGNVEVFEDVPPTRPHRFGDLRRIGLDQPDRALRAARALLRRHREAPFDLVISNGVAGWPLTLARLPVPAVQVYHLTVAGLARQALGLRGDRITTGHVTALFDRIAGVGKHVVAVSPRVLGEVESYYGLRGRCIPPGVDTSMFSPMDRAAARATLDLPRDRPIGLFAGRPNPSKGYDILQRIAGRLPEVLFLVAGGTGARQRNLCPIGRIPHSEMPLWYSASDFLINPSRYEGFNLVILEALACDRPVVASAAAFSIPEHPSRCGVVVPENDEGAYVRAIQEVLASGPLHPRGVVLPRYSFERFVASWHGLVESLVGDGAGSSVTNPSSA